MGSGLWQRSSREEGKELQSPAHWPTGWYRGASPPLVVRCHPAPSRGLRTCRLLSGSTDDSPGLCTRRADAQKATPGAPQATP